jgi:hypothetical protein
MKRAFALIATAAAALAHGDDWKSFSVRLAPGAMHEECARVEAGEKRRYHWKADNAVDFNVHFHDGEKVTFPLKRDGMRGDGGTFEAKRGEDYCWMWTARNLPVKLEGRIELK